MIKNDVKVLFKTQDSKKKTKEQLSSKSIKFKNTKRRMESVCTSLSIPTSNYDPEKTMAILRKFIDDKNKLDRMLYSEISNYIYTLEVFKRGIFATNVESLLLYSLDSANSIDCDCKKIVIKLYDHTQLSLHQIENANNIFVNSIDEAKENFQSQIKSVEKEYVTILGIFASIVLAFVGGITFSTSVLQNISESNIFRLLIVIDFLAFVLINVIHILAKFIFELNNKKSEMFNVKNLNIICFWIAFLVIIGWLLNLDDLADFISSMLPW